jgi:GalNAc-alpha-(1->4)-GalNAc-alpha-(1->3)-diNAcBac-PP-undecaprenol alpha-1,4-N-acetyl-D-galactosaminyltransferase
MKLVLVISSLTSGGAERVLSILANSWVERGWQVTLVTTHDDGSPSFYDLDSRVKTCPILLSEIPGGGLFSNLKRVFSLRRMIKDEAPDLVVSFLNYTNILVLLSTLGIGFPVAISERLDPRIHKLNLAWHTLRKLLYPRARVLVNQTEAAAGWFRPWLGDRVCVVANPVLNPRFDSGELELELPQNSVLAMGRLHPQKGFDTLLKAMVTVHETMPEVRLAILGEGPLRAELENERSRLGLEEVVSFPGRFKRPQDILRRADLFVLSSVTEGFPNVLCEAMAVGLPVIATNCPSGPDEIVVSGQNGLLVPVGDSQAMAEAIITLMKDPKQRNELGSRAKAITSTFSLEKVLARWDQILLKAGLDLDEPGESSG